MYNHYDLLDLPLGYKSKAKWARKPSGKAMIFIHGFGGKSINTWSQFETLIPSYKQLAGYDLIFYGYHSMRKGIDDNAEEFLRFLDIIGSTPSAIINQSVHTSNFDRKRDKTFHYDKISILAHSLGAVVTRSSLLKAHNIRYGPKSSLYTWLDTISLLLYAPAHSGADIIKLATDFMGVFRIDLSRIKFALSFIVKPLNDLEVNSDFLQKLKIETDKSLSILGSKSHLKAQLVLIGSKDDIVSPKKFCEDPDPVTIENKDHTSICKPSQKSIDPLNEILNML